MDAVTKVLKECAYSYDGVNTWIMKDEVLGIINNVPTVEERPQDEQKDIDIPKMCEECHSQSYNNGFDAGYELGKEDAQKHITELNERIEYGSDGLPYKMGISTGNKVVPDQLQGWRYEE